MMLGILGVYASPVVLVGGFVWWMSRRSRASRAKGEEALERGRVLEALQHFERCEDHLVLKGRANLWLWRVSTAASQFEQAIRFNASRHEAEAAPLMALAVALRNDPDASLWRRDTQHHPVGKLASAVAAMRAQDWNGALALLHGLAVPGARGRGFHGALMAWAQTELDGQRRVLDSAAALGEGSLDELASGWPELGDRLRRGECVKVAPR
jgi:hypothetical protein